MGTVCIVTARGPWFSETLPSGLYTTVAGAFGALIVLQGGPGSQDHSAKTAEAHFHTQLLTGPD